MHEPEESLTRAAARRTRPWGWCASTLIAVAVLTFAAHGHAEPDEATRLSARVLGDEGQQLFQDGDYAGALDRYERAAKLVAVPALHVRIARCLVKLRRLVEASEQYLKASRMPLPAENVEIHAKARQEAIDEREELVPRIPAVVVVVEPRDAAAQVTIDGQPLDGALLGARRLVDPGKHVIEGKVGAETRSATIESRETVVESVTLTFVVKPAPAVAKSPPTLTPRLAKSVPQRTGWSGQAIAGHVLMGIGGAGVIVGAITGGLGLSEKSRLIDEERCVESDDGIQCTEDVFGEYNALRVTSAVGLYAGLAIAGAGVIMVLTAPWEDAPASGATLTIVPDGFVLRGSF